MMKKIIKSVCCMLMLALVSGCASAHNKLNTRVEIVSDGNGNKQSETIATYDSQGNIVEISSETGTISYVYENGDCVQIIEGDRVTKYSYKNHLLSKSEVFQNDNKIKSSIFIYDGNGNQIQEITIGKSLKESEQITKVYNDNGLLVKIISQKVNNEITITLNEYDNVGNLIAASTYADEKLVDKVKFEYRNNELVKEERERADTQTVTVTDYSYDGKGKLVEKRITVGKSPKPRTIISYKYSE